MLSKFAYATTALLAASVAAQPIAQAPNAGAVLSAVEALEPAVVAEAGATATQVAAAAAAAKRGEMPEKRSGCLGYVNNQCPPDSCSVM